MLTDFGSSKYQFSTEKNNTEAGDSGTLVYSSPERLNDDPFKEKEDVWAMGVTIYFLSSFVLPFNASDRNKGAIIKKITDLGITHQKIEIRSKELNDLIDVLLQKDYNKRPSIKELFLNYPIVQTAVCDFLQRFLPIKNFIFEELILRL
jgi:serine/threonine protein kinase